MTIAELTLEIEAMFDELRGLNDPVAVCYQCSGTGVVPWFKHVEDGVCFVCRGTGEIPAYILPENMAVCVSCDKAVERGGQWVVDEQDNVICNACFEDVTGLSRYYTSHNWCGLKDTLVLENRCMDCKAAYEAEAGIAQVANAIDTRVPAHRICGAFDAMPDTECRECLDIVGVQGIDY